MLYYSSNRRWKWCVKRYRRRYNTATASSLTWWSIRVRSSNTAGWVRHFNCNDCVDGFQSLLVSQRRFFTHTHTRTNQNFLGIPSATTHTLLPNLVFDRTSWEFLKCSWLMWVGHSIHPIPFSYAIFVFTYTTYQTYTSQKSTPENVLLGCFGPAMLEMFLFQWKSSTKHVFRRWYKCALPPTFSSWTC